MNKKLSLITTPMLAITFLTCCNNSSAKTFHVKFTNGNEVVSTKDYKENEVIVAPEGIPEYKGEKKEHKTYTFNAWYEGDFKFETGLKATKDYNFAAKFIEEDKEYTITYELNGGTAEGNPTTYTFQEDVTLNNPTQVGFTFKGWCLKPDGNDPLKESGWKAGEKEGNITLYADWHVEGKTLENYSWEQINKIAGDYEGSKYFDVGDTKTVTIDDIAHQVRIIGFNHDSLTSDPTKTANITFEFANLITKSDGYLKPHWDDTKVTSTKNYNFPGSTLNTYLNGSSTNPTIQPVLDMLPDDLEGSIKEVNKNVGVSTDDGENYSAETYKTKLFPLAIHEIVDADPDFVTEGEGVLYQYYKIHSADNERIKRPVEATAESYWLRTPNTFYDDAAFNINYNGYVYGTSKVYLTSDYGVAPAFCI